MFFIFLELTNYHC